ncbi:MAG: hypothetical protein ABIB43_06665 [archaeon]
MDNIYIAPIVILVLAGLYFLGSGITGEVISQSCCFPPDCEPTNLCEAARPFLETPGGVNN